MTGRTAKRCAGIGQSPTVRLNDQVKALRASGVDVLDVGGGDPDFDTPAHVTAAAVSAMEAGFTHYTPSRGIPELLRAISDKLWRDNGVVADPARDIIVTPSSKHALFIALMAVLDPGDELLIPTPGWVSYQSMAALAGARPVPVETSAGDGFALSRSLLDRHVTARTKAIVINSPHNPTGRVLSAAEADLIASFAAEHDLFVVTDEIYEKIVYGGAEHVSMAARPGCAERTLTVNGFSKGYAMPGWRLGYVAGPADVIAAMLAIHQHTVACAGSFVQAGAIAALTGHQDAVAAMAAEYSARADRIVAGLNAIPGITCRAPAGAFYAFADIRGTGMGSSAEFAEALLDKAGVAVTPGSAFGPGGEGHVRLSFATSMDVIETVLTRMATFVTGSHHSSQRSSFG